MENIYQWFWNQNKNNIEQKEEKDFRKKDLLTFCEANNYEEQKECKFYKQASFRNRCMYYRKEINACTYF